MKSPFPGMDPYLERRWGDVHTGLCIGIRAALQPKLPAGLRARAQEDVLLEDHAVDETKYFEPDVAIVQTFDPQIHQSAGAIAFAVEPVAIRHLPRPRRSRWVEILDTADGNRVVTAIEILSPGNKSPGKLCRANDPSLWLAYPMPLRSPLPAVPIPCRESDIDVALELQPVLDRIYDEGAHDDLDYSIPPEPPFSSPDAKWAAERIAAARK